MSAMHNPPHPGEILREDVLTCLGLPLDEVAERFAIPSNALSKILAGRAAITPDLATRLEMAGFSTAKTWLAMQANYDQAQALPPAATGPQADQP